MKTDPSNAGTAGTVNNLTPVEELLRAGKALGDVVIPPKGHQPYVLTPPGYELQPVPLSALRPLPDHIRQRVTLLDADSFVLYVKAFRTSTARLFCSPIKLEALTQGTNGGAEFTALLDYHAGGRADDAGMDPNTSKTATDIQLAETTARRVAHVATYPVPLSLEFLRWMTLNGYGMAQMDFVAFIEANCADVKTPDSATIMELALNFEAKTSVTFQSKAVRVTGARDLIFQETVEAGGGPGPTDKMRVPEWLDLRMPIFEGGKSYDLRARMEYRPAAGKLTITYHLQRPHQVFREAWQDLRSEIAAALETSVLTGHATLTPGWDSAD